ncbi:MAG: MFS transporter [Bacillaceae bacterium]
MRAFFYVLIMLAFFDMFSQLPIMSTFAQEVGGTPFLIGIVVGMYSITNMIGNLVVGSLLTKYSPKIILTGALLLTGGTVTTYLLVEDIYTLIGIRFIHGFVSGFIVPSLFTIVANGAKEEAQGRSMAMSGAAIGLAAIVGPAFGGIMKKTAGIEMVFITVAILLIATAIIVLLFVPNQERQASTQTISLKDYFVLLKNRGVWLSLCTSFGLMFTLGTLTYLLPLKVENLNMSAATSGTLLSTFGVSAIFIFATPLNRIFDRYSPLVFMKAGKVIIAIVLVLLTFATTKSALYTLLAIYGIGYAFLFPSSSRWLVLQVPVLQRGTAFGLYYACFSLGVIFGSFTSGAIGGTNSAFLVSSIILIILLFITIALQKNPVIPNNKTVKM